MDIARPKLLLLLFCAFFVHTVQADQNMDSGFYVSGSIGQDRIQSGIPEENTTLLRATLGWQFNPMLGVEFAYNDLGQFPGPTPVFTDFDMTGVSAAVVGSLPVSEAVAVFAKAGQIWWSTDSSFFFFGRNTGINQTGTLSFSESDAFLGLGVSYELSQQLELELEYNDYRFEFPGHTHFDNKSAAVLLSLKWER